MNVLGIGILYQIRWPKVKKSINAMATLKNFYCPPSFVIMKNYVCGNFIALQLGV
jgi:hypothetical protein